LRRKEAETKAKKEAEIAAKKAAKEDAALRKELEAKKLAEARALAKQQNLEAKAAKKARAEAEKKHKDEVLARAKSIAAAKKAKSNEKTPAKIDNLETPNPEIPILEIIDIEASPSFDFEGYRARIAATDSPSAKNFKERIGKEFDEHSFQEAAKNNPEEARRILSEEIEN
jgi:hypothetical protein